MTRIAPVSRIVLLRALAQLVVAVEGQTVQQME
jgi:hypothetical protein